MTGLRGRSRAPTCGSGRLRWRWRRARKYRRTFRIAATTSCANLLRKTLPERNIAIKLNADATFEFPYGDGYWSKLLNRSYSYEDELELLFRDSVDVDYTLLDCGANFGYWSVLVSSAPYGSHKAIAIEPSSQNFAKLANNAEINGNRFEVMKCAIGAARGTARLSGTKHEAFSIAGGADSGGEEVPVIALDNLHRRRQDFAGRKIPDQARRRRRRGRGHQGRHAAVAGRQRVAVRGARQRSATTRCRAISSNRRRCKLIVYDPRSNRLETVTELSILDRIKVSSHVGYNVFGTASAFWQDRINALNANAARRMQ